MMDVSILPAVEENASRIGAAHEVVRFVTVVDVDVDDRCLGSSKPLGAISHLHTSM